MTLYQLYQQARLTPSSINQFVPLLYDLARQCNHVTEFGTEIGISTTAFLYAQPLKLTCYDVRPMTDPVHQLKHYAGRTEFTFVEADDRLVEIAETDLLFIDTDHTYAQLRDELRLHADKARRWIALHDTETFPELLIAIEEFVSDGKWWQFHLRYTINNGMTVLARTPGNPSIPAG